jgi:hypothetical protein
MKKAFQSIKNKAKILGLTALATYSLFQANEAKALTVNEMVNDTININIPDSLNNYGTAQFNGFFSPSHTTEWINATTNDNGVYIVNNVSSNLGADKLVIIDQEFITNNQNTYDALVEGINNNTPEYKLVELQNSDSHLQGLNKIRDALGLNEIENSYAFSVLGYTSPHARIIALNPENETDTLALAQEIAQMYNLSFQRPTSSQDVRFIVESDLTGATLDTLIYGLSSSQQNFINLILPEIHVNNNEYSVKNSSVFPNPFTENVTIDLDKQYDNVRVDLFDMTGKQVKTREEKTSGEIKLNTQELPAGNYIINVVSGKENAQYKVVKQ